MELVTRDQLPLGLTKDDAGYQVRLWTPQNGEQLMTWDGTTWIETNDSTDMVNHPAHYLNENCPRIKVYQQGEWEPSDRFIECIEIMRWIRDPRLADAFKYLWRVAFGGKGNDREDVEKLIWYLTDWLDNPT